MNITINGKRKFLEDELNPPTLLEVIKSLGYNSSLIVIEYNGAILPPSKWKEQRIQDKDNLEVVTIVGGGS